MHPYVEVYCGLVFSFMAGSFTCGTIIGKGQVNLGVSLYGEAEEVQVELGTGGLMLATSIILWNVEFNSRNDGLKCNR